MSVERRLTHRLVDYWQQIKEGKILPSESDIDSEEIEDMWDFCFLLQIRGDELMMNQNAYSFSYVGKGLDNLFISGEEGEPGYVVTLPPEKLTAIVSEMMMTKLPIVEEDESFDSPIGQIKYRQCILPIGTESGEVRGILGGMRYKEDDETFL